MGDVVQSVNQKSSASGAKDSVAGSSKAPVPDPAISQNDVAAPALPFHRAAKRAFDLIAAVTGLVMFSPMFLLVSMAIKFNSRARILFPQVRYGYNGETILVLKFRSNEIVPRLAHVGCVISWTGIDGLPQLINVLRGEMSIVGPEPFSIVHKNISEELFSLNSRQHQVKPGIIGWAQVNGCWGETNTREAVQRRIDYDRYYIDNCSFLFDIKIMLRTLFSTRAYS